MCFKNKIDKYSNYWNKKNSDLWWCQRKINVHLLGQQFFGYIAYFIREYGGGHSLCPFWIWNLNYPSQVKTFNCKLSVTKLCHKHFSKLLHQYSKPKIICYILKFWWARVYPKRFFSTICLSLTCWWESSVHFF